jgi:hypothetical protein
VIMRTERPCPDIVDGKAGAPLPVDQWKAWTIAEYLAEVQVAARAFMALGLKTRDAVAICERLLPACRRDAALSRCPSLARPISATGFVVLFETGCVWVWVPAPSL